MNHVQIKISFNSMCVKSIHHNNLHKYVEFLTHSRKLQSNSPANKSPLLCFLQGTCVRLSCFYHPCKYLRSLMN